MPLRRRQILGLVCFPLGFVVLWFAVQAALLSGLKDYRTGRLGVWNKVTRGEVNSAILLAGSSRTWVHFDPRAIQEQAGRSAFNIGRDGTLPDLQLAFLKMYLRHNKKPEYLVQGLDITMFHRSTGVYDAQQYVGHLDEPEIGEALCVVDPAFSWYKRFPLWGIVKTRAAANALRGLLGRCAPEDHIDGYQPQALRWRDDFDRFKQQNPNGLSVTIEPEAVAALRELLSLCATNGIRVVLVYTPEYKENQELTLNRKEVFAQFEKLAAEFGVPFWDYSQWRLCGDNRFFYNSQHLNQEGAREFSQDFARKFASYVSEEKAGPGRVTAVEPAGILGLLESAKGPLSAGQRATLVQQIKATGNVNAVDTDGRSGLIHAVRIGDLETVKLLVEAGIYVKIRDRFNKTALLYAVDKGRRDIVDYLASNGDLQSVSPHDRVGNKAR